ncbi:MULTISPECIES: cobyric acid synthase CobQ [Chroococcidiopsis]|jgi:adenosylcobyric acid synthase|uniref:Cobyric acid synthase n=1 Tax=Chroococcidiopsis thermalis (strain PCC 7203) TaxID=251229 RepID=K9U7U0_CHRTP|nr:MULTISPECIES: cobyric acid synthase CobQ [Chroococcidiopsis]AFY90910.1 adenosylcobyric acid synthase (glutamine-hydrolysing) [Chroococcidiopsis thermalis PCC 7203]MBD2307863.1 cobyric acid synthase CobQ [Chroococcidiopsis sp. [FACHB-1243]]PSB45249.1 cobyric acid synthase CobQ [Cyanosarcina cf. burmensis CCALA 770]URD49767.1 cobyric acid synthase CobQ [Chroococcidiopsis sp. CCNUC1]
MKSIMIVGTTSHAGKSTIAAAICRILAKRGWRVAPFKGQNMALNAYVTVNGGEIGYAQAVQAWAAGVAPMVEMNPILLKPQGDMSSQVILKGKAVGRVNAADYYEQFFQPGWQAIEESLRHLSAEFDMIVCEGAGSPAEINLKHRDLANMRIAKYLNAPTLLVVDIDRGGAFAHVVGTLELLEPEERSLVRGIIINKFRGQRSILEPGIKWLEERTGIPVIGVIPWLDHSFPAEDSLDLFERKPSRAKGELNIVVIRLPRISNFTDFDPLESEPCIGLRYLSPKHELGHPDAVILPGTKTTIADLLVLHKTGMAKSIQNYAAAGGTVLGICGGFQILGQQLADPEGLEGEAGRYPGLGLLPIRTAITMHKVARQRQVISNFPQSGLPVSGYEIHQGRSRLVELPPAQANDYQPLFDDTGLGMVDSSQSIWGTYLHGIFDNGPWRRAWLNRLRQQRGLKSLPTGISNYREQREAMLDSLAGMVETHLDLSSVLSP